MTAVAGDVSLSALECASGPETRRRVNLTLFNAGDEAATFTVSAVSAAADPGTGSTEQALRGTREVPRPVQRPPARHAPGLPGRRRLVPDHGRPAVPRLRLHRPTRETPRRPPVRDLPGAARPLTSALPAACPAAIPTPAGAGLSGPRSSFRDGRSRASLPDARPLGLGRHHRRAPRAAERGVELGEVRERAEDAVPAGAVRVGVEPDRGAPRRGCCSARRPRSSGRSAGPG